MLIIGNVAVKRALRIAQNDKRSALDSQRVIFDVSAQAKYSIAKLFNMTRTSILRQNLQKKSEPLKARSEED
jgi:hypothetical protein